YVSMTTTLTTTGVYHTTLGPRWSELHDAVRRLHRPGATVTATGVFRIRHGNLLARLLARIAGLPAAGEGVDFRLVVPPNEQGEQWDRNFDGRFMSSTQRTHADSVIVERIGLQEVHLGVNVVDGVLHYHGLRAAICLGPLRIPIPAPRFSASEKAVDNGV